MTLDEAIKHAEEVAEEKESEAQDLEYSKLDWKHEANRCSKCAEEHRQLAEWLKDYKRLLEQARWIPVSERLPGENGVYIVSYEDSVRLLEWFNGKWFFYPSNPAREETGTIIAWQLLPEPYKVESEKEE